MTEWQKRFVKEYHELRGRFTKLDEMIEKYEKGQLEFEPKCPIDLLKGQRRLCGIISKFSKNVQKLKKLKYKTV